MSSFFCLSQVLQLIVVVSPDWESVDGTLCCFERKASSGWEVVGQPVEVSLGKEGMAWGRGLLDLPRQGVEKMEGDNKSPAGLFSLGPIFGDRVHQEYARCMPFMLITDDLECVDDPSSGYYNQLVYANAIEERDWTSSEKMKEIGFLYDIGVVIQQNHNPVKAGMGSAVFMHIWRGIGMGTAGCTAMNEENLSEIVAWLNCAKHPCLLQLPAVEYARLQLELGLPEVNRKERDSNPRYP